MKRKLCSILLLTLPLMLAGQINLGCKLNGGLSWISNTYNPTNVTFEVHPAFSFQAGLFFNIHRSDKFVIETELLFVQIEGRDKIENLRDGRILLSEYNHISYLSVPFHCGWKFGKFAFNLGFQLSFVLNSSGKETGSWDQGIYESTWEIEYDELDIPGVDFGPRIGVIYNLNNKIAFEALYYHGITKINTNQEYNLERYIQQATIGIRYTFWTRMKEDN